MRIGLASYRSKNKDVTFNLMQIENAMRKVHGKVDLICFGEAFLQGFESLCWNYNIDKDMAVEVESPTIVYTFSMTIGILVCCICDIAVSGMLTWSLITLSSILFTWIVTFPIMLLGRKGILISMILNTVFIIPFMYILSILIKVKDIFRVGRIMSIIALVFLWIIFGLYHGLKERKRLVAGIIFLLAIPFILLVNIVLSKMITTPVIDIWDILAMSILLIAAIAFIIGDYKKEKSIG